MVHVTLIIVINVQNDALLPQCIFQLFEETIDVYVKACLFQYWHNHFICAPSCFLEYLVFHISERTMYSIRKWFLQKLFIFI